MKKLILATVVAAHAWTAAFGWGQKGHDVTAYIAEQHLTPVAAAAVDSLLEGRSMVYWANWLDNASYNAPYQYTKPWHYKNVNADETYQTAQVNPAGDAILGLKSQFEVLADPDAKFADKQLALKILTHVMGDIHQPMHMGRATDSGGNRVKVKYFDRETNLHSVWDSSLPEGAHKWSYTEWQQQLDRLSPEQQAEVTQGWFDDWAEQSVGIASKIYTYFSKPGFKIMYNDIAYWTPTIETQLLNGGLRLAHVLNTVLDPAYAAQAGTSALIPDVRANTGR